MGLYQIDRVVPVAKVRNVDRVLYRFPGNPVLVCFHRGGILLRPELDGITLLHPGSGIGSVKYLSIETRGRRKGQDIFVTYICGVLYSGFRHVGRHRGFDGNRCDLIGIDDDARYAADYLGGPVMLRGGGHDICIPAVPGVLYRERICELIGWRTFLQCRCVRSDIHTCNLCDVYIYLHIIRQGRGLISRYGGHHDITASVVGIRRYEDR